jgi:hypothetical protein
LAEKLVTHPSSCWPNLRARSGSLASLQGLSARGHELYPALRESFSGHDLELDAVLDDPQIGEER